MSETDIMKMKVADLKRELKLRGLSTTGNKTELQDRLQSVMLDGDLSLEDAVIGDGLLDDVLTDEEEKAALESPTDKEILDEAKIEDKEPIAETVNPLPKKVVLKRKSSLTHTHTITGNLSTVSKENAAPSDKIAKMNDGADQSNGSEEQSIESLESSDGKKVVKLSQLSMKERLEMRAKKFGTPKDPTNKGSDPIKFEKDSNQIETLKKRAERFGCVLSSKMAEIEKEEKLQKRRERFGLSTKSTITGPGTPAVKGDYEEKAKLRLERFKAK